MPSITYNGQSFAIDGRRVWILGASIQYARVPQAFWRARIAAARQAGFNTIETAAVWSLHEQRKGRFVFDEQADIRKFIEACHAEGMKVVLRVGPFVGHDFDAGGIPGWLIDTSPAAPPASASSASSASSKGPMALRESNEAFLEHVSRYFRKLLGQVSDLTASDDGPIVLVQSEHAWTCSNPAQAEKYLHELTRMIRESGVNVPIINANDLWQESPGTIDTWRGSEHLLFQLRQMRTVQPAAPLIVSEFAASRSEVWGDGASLAGAGRRRKTGAFSDESHDPMETLEQLAEVLAAGAQPIVSPFHGGTNFGFLGGHRPGGSSHGGGFITTHAGGDAPLGEAGERTEKYNIIKRLMTFANHFSGVFAELDPDFQPITLDPDEARRAGATSIVSQRGSQGRAVFIFGKPSDQPVTLVLNNGLRLPITLGDQPVTWTVLDADLQGAGRLDYCNICPWAVVDRSIVVFHGPAKAPVYLSIDNVPLEAVVPAEGAGSKPLVLEHHNLTIVILNRSQVDSAYFNGQQVYVGVGGLDAHNRVMAATGGGGGASSKAWVISAGARIEPLAITAEKPKGRKRSKKDDTVSSDGAAGGVRKLAIGEWSAQSSHPHVAGNSPRFASLDGPATLSECGAPNGYGWYRVRFAATGKAAIMLAEAGDRLHVFVDGKAQRIVGQGHGAKRGPFEIKFDKTEKNLHTMVVLADNLGRSAGGNDLARRKGLFGHVYAVKPIRSKAKIATAKPVNGFALRGFIEGRSSDQLGDVRQAIWTFQHPRKTPVIIDVDGVSASGTFVLNDKPLAYFAGITGYGEDRIVVHPEDGKTLKRGKNVLRFVPDHGGADAEELARRTTLYEAAGNLTEKADWAFAKWEPTPPPTGRAAASASHSTADKATRGLPCWWRAAVDIDAGTAAADTPLWLDVSSMSKGQVFINGHNIGRYFTATADGKAVGPQTRLYVPTPWLHAGSSNEVMIFDEHGFNPAKVRLVAR